MILDIDGLDVYFPYSYIYPEQFTYMLELKKTLDVEGHVLLEMPSGTGKTVSLLSLIISYKVRHPEIGKLIYCSRTVPEIEKVLEELKMVINYTTNELRKINSLPLKWPPLAMGLSAKRTLCIHETVSQKHDREIVDSLCRDLTASWVREKSKTSSNIPTCSYFENLDFLNNRKPSSSSSSSKPISDNEVDITYRGPSSSSSSSSQAPGGTLRIPRAIYSLDDLKELGREKIVCPYYLARQTLEYADIVVYSFVYLLDPKVAHKVSENFEGNSIVVFDEAHNIDNACIEGLSVNLSRKTLDASSTNLTNLSNAVREMKSSNAERLQDEYTRLVEGLASSGVGSRSDLSVPSPVLPDDILEESVPGNIRKAEHFIAFLKRFIEYIKNRLKTSNVVQESPTAFTQALYNLTTIDTKPLKFVAERLGSLMRTLQLSNLADFTPITLVASFATLVASYSKGFTIIIESINPKTSEPDPVLQFCCLDATLAIKPVFEKYRNVVITSGTLSPIDMYPKILNFNPVNKVSLNMTLSRECVCPLVVTRGSDQVAISSKFEVRSDPSVVRNYGALLSDLVAVVPDGIVCFFTSYEYMESIVAKWHDTGVIRDVLKHKLIFVETTDYLESSLALENYKRACDVGRGAVLLSVARGKVSEGIDFDHHYGRCVILMGIPYQYTKSLVLRARLEYLRMNYRIRENDFLTFDAMRAGAQCMGRVIRSKNDYGLMIFADKRYPRQDKRNKLPKWITQHLSLENMNLSTDMAVVQARSYLRKMAQPRTKEEQLGTALWSIEHVNAYIKALENEQLIQSRTGGLSTSNHIHANNHNIVVDSGSGISKKTFPSNNRAPTQVAAHIGDIEESDEDEDSDNSQIEPMKQ